MSFGSIKIYGPVITASGASTSSDIALGGKPWTQVGVRVGTMSTGVNVQVQNSIDGGTTFYNVFHPAINSTTVKTNPLIISGLVGDNGGYVMLPAGTVVNHVRFVGTGVVSGGISFSVVCSD